MKTKKKKNFAFKISYSCFYIHRRFRDFRIFQKFIIHRLFVAKGFDFCYRLPGFRLRFEVLEKYLKIIQINKNLKYKIISEKLKTKNANIDIFIEFIL